MGFRVEGEDPVHHQREADDCYSPERRGWLAVSTGTSLVYEATYAAAARAEVSAGSRTPRMVVIHGRKNTERE